jgi:hypothetical protein
VNLVVLLLSGILGSLVRAVSVLVRQPGATIASDVSTVPLGAPESAAGTSETQYAVLGVNIGERPVPGLRLAVRCGRGSEFRSPAAVLQPAAAGVTPRVTARADGLDCEVSVLGPGQGLSLSFVLRSPCRSDVDFAWSSPAGRVTVESTGPPAVSLEGRLVRLASAGLAGLLVVRWVPHFVGLLPAGNWARAVTAASWAVAAGCFAWAGFGFYDLVRDALRRAGRR